MDSIFQRPRIEKLNETPSVYRGSHNKLTSFGTNWEGQYVTLTQGTKIQSRDISIRHLQYGGICLHFTCANFSTVFSKSNFKVTLVFSAMTQSILQGKVTNFVFAATEVEALYARFFTFLWLVTHLCHFYRHFEFICLHNHHAQIHCHEVNCSVLFPVDFGRFFCLGKLSCTMFKGFVATLCQSLRTFCNTTRTRGNDIFGVEFIGRNLSLSAHFISSLFLYLQR